MNNYNASINLDIHIICKFSVEIILDIFTYD